MQLSFVLFFALIVQALNTSAVTTHTPTPSTSTSTPAKYAPGDMIVARPYDWGEQNKGFHPGVIVGQNPHNQKYKIAQISVKLPRKKYRHRDDALKYHPNANKKNSKINTGRPVEVAEKDLRLANPDHWHTMEPVKLAALMEKINKNCHDALRKRGLGCSGPKPNKNASKGKSDSRQLNGKKAWPKSAPQGKSRQLQGKKAWPRPAPPGKLRQVRLQGKKTWTKPNQSVLKSKPRQLHGKKA